MLSQKRLKELLKYDPETGIFRWRVVQKGVVYGAVAGFKRPDKRYFYIGIDYKSYLTHRLVWLYVHGYFPENEIDHINQNKDDNRVVNLREVTSQCNKRNRGNPINNTSGVKGVCWSTDRLSWAAYITVSGKTTNLGRWVDLDEAVCIRLATEQCLGWLGCDSNSPAKQYVTKMREIR